MVGESAALPAQRIAPLLDTVPTARSTAEWGDMTLLVDRDTVSLTARLVRPVRCGYFFCVESYVHLEINDRVGSVRVVNEGDPHTSLRLQHTAGAVFLRSVSARDRISLGQHRRNVSRLLERAGIAPGVIALVPVVEDQTGVRAVLAAPFGGRTIIADGEAVDAGPAVTCAVSVKR